MRVVGDVGWWLHSAGVDKLPILNGHGGNVAPLTCAARTLEHDLALSTGGYGEIRAQMIGRDITPKASTSASPACQHSPSRLARSV